MSSSWPIRVEAFGAEPACVGNHHGGCWKSCCLRDHPQSHGRWTWIGQRDRWNHAGHTAKSLGQVPWQTRYLSEPIQKELFEIKDFDVVWLPRAYMLTLILGTRPGNRGAWETPWFNQTVSNSCGSKNSWQCLNSRNLWWMHCSSQWSTSKPRVLARGSCCWERHRQTSRFAKILIWLSAVSKWWTKLRNSVSVWRKSRTRRTSRRSCHFENVAKRFIKPDLGGIGQQVNGAGIRDLANTRVPEWKAAFFVGRHVCWFQNEKRPLSCLRYRGHFSPFVRCAVQHVRSLSESEKKIVQHRKHRSHQFPKTLSDVCHTAHFLISRHRQMLLMMLGEEEITGWDPRSTRDPTSSSSFWPHQSDATSRLGPGLMPPSRQMRTGDEMSVQEPETTHVSAAYPSMSEAIPSDVAVASVEPEDSVQTTSMRRILFKRPPNPLDRVEPPKRTRGDDDDHSAFLSTHIMIGRRCQKFWKMGRVSSVEQGRLTCWIVLGLRLKFQLEHRKAKHWQKHSPLNLCRKMSTICWSQSVFRWTKRRYNKSAAIPIQKQPSMWRSDDDVQKWKCQLCQLNRNVSLSKRKTRKLSTFVKYSVVEAASRQGISPSALMKMRWVVTFKYDGSLKARLVVQGFTNQRLGEIPTSSPTASRRSRQIFLTLAASFVF